MKVEMGEREKRWELEKTKMRGKIEKIEGEMKRLVTEKERKRKEGIKVEARKKEERERETEEMRESLKTIEWRLERKEGEERKGNIIIKGIKEERRELKEEVVKLFREIEVEAPMGEVKRIGRREKDKAGMALIKIGNMDIKKEIMEKRKRLKGREERIEDDLTWRERKMMWNLGLIARKEEREGKRTWIKYERIRIEGKWW
ncbi:hypothetical protein RF55_6394 [Lasius niger]|uniref:Uncharacterized protein n=1 Tax=Lasius niger TaxID=67767 RepID=A0A0J7KT43_LASNI|nr:hypothetical protein RF55_6394 [Lasius niger]